MMSKKSPWLSLLPLLLIGGLLLFSPLGTPAPDTLDDRPAEHTRSTATRQQTSRSGAAGKISTVQPKPNHPAQKATPRPPVTTTPFRPALNSAAPTRKATQPAPPAPPASAQIEDISGYDQLLPLSCEARAAADWARHFGIIIHELDFMARLPVSDNPEKGFAGSPYGDWGQIPPGPYGVHAMPVAQVLKSYGAPARAARHLRLLDLQREIAAGRPVMVWVVGHVEPGKGVPYPVDGIIVTVARYEHTVLLTGYSPQEVTILDGKKVYQRPLEIFLQSWGVLENMAIVWEANTIPLLPATCESGKGC